MNAFDRLHILLIEDNEDDFIIVRDLLRDIDPQKFTLEWVNSYEEGLAAVQAARHDLILLDFRLSYHTGLELLNETMSVSSRAPVIFMTGQGDYEIDVQAMQSGAADYLVKDSLNADILERAIRYAVDRRRSAEALRAGEERYRAFVKNSSEGIWRFELEPPLSTEWPEKEQMAHLCRYATVAECNDAVAQMYGFEHAVDVLGAPLGDLFSLDSSGYSECLGSFVSANYQSVNCEAFETDRHGTLKYISHTLTGVLENGFLHRVWGTLSDITERKRAEVAQADLGAIIASSDAAIISYTLDGLVVTWNKGAEVQYGYLASEIIGQSIAVLIPPDRDDDLHSVLHEELRFLLSQIRRGESVPAFESTRICKDGARIDISVAVSPIVNARGEVTGGSSVSHDISARKAAERRLRASEANMAAAQRIAHFGSWESEPGAGDDGSVIPQIWSDETFRIFGYEPGTVSATNALFFQAVPPEDHPVIKQAVAVAIAERQPTSYTHRVWRPNGEERIVLETVEFFDEEASGQPARLVGTVHDITEPRRAEEEIRFQALLLSQVRNAVVATDLTGRIIYWNSFAETLYQWKAEEVNGKNVAEVSSPPESQTVAEEVMSEIREKGSWQGEWVARRKDGSAFTVFVVDSLFRDSDGSVAGIVGVSVDITERKQAEEALRANEQKLQLTLESGRFGTFELDLVTGRYLEISDMGRDQFTLPSHGDVFIGDFLQKVHPDDLTEMQAVVARASATQDANFESDYRIVLSDGSIRCINVHGALTYDDPGLPVRMLGITQDITERKEAEEALRESEQKFRNIIETTLEGVIMVGAESQITYVNQRVCEMLGYTADELIGQERFFLVADEDREQARQSFERRHQGMREQFDRRFRHKNGSLIWAIVSGTPVLDKDGRTIGSFIMIIDITERRQAEEARDRFIAIMDTTPDFVGMSDSHGRNLYLNRAARRMMGIDETADVAELAIAQCHPDDVAQRILTEGIPAAMRDGVWAGETAILNRDGSATPISQVIIAHTDAAGQVLFFSTIGRNITDLKRVEEELRTAQERFALAVRGSSDGIWDWNVLTNDVYYSPRMKEMMGYGEDEIDNEFSAWESRLDSEDHERTMEALRAHVEDHVPYDVEYRFHTKTDVVRWIRARGQALWDENGQATRVAGSISDITGLKEIEESLRNAQIDLEMRVELRTQALQRAVEEAERANAAKSDFLSRMSHELRTPMNSILGFAQIMEMDAPSEAQSVRLGHIMRAGQHLLLLINEVLDTARVESGRLQVSSEPVPLSNTLRMATNLIRPLCEPRDQRIVCDWAICEPLYVKADQQRLSQVMINLLSNAAKFNRDGGVILVQCEQRTAGRLRIRVSDSGVGIPADQIEKLFQPFERLGAEGGPIEGTGLGLSLSKRLVELMDGTIGVESVVGVGSTFWVELPQAESPVPLIADIPVGLLSTEAGENQCSILYIEDNDANLQVVAHVLSTRPEYQLLSATSGFRGLQIAHSKQPSLILLDLHLPDMPGYEVLSHLQSDPVTRKIPVVVVSADATPRQIRRIMDAGAAEYLTKPLDVRLFLDILHKRLSQKEQPGN